MADQWARLDPATYPFVRDLAAQLRDHDDREQFLAGVDVIVAGIETLRVSSTKTAETSAGEV